MDNQSRRRSPLAAFLAVLGAVALAVGCFLTYVALRGPEAPVYVDMYGHQVEVENSSVNDPEWVEKANLEQVTGASFRVPEKGLIYPYGEVNQVNGVINPPNFQGVFRVRNLGVDLTRATEGTVYLATHALRGGGRSPGNDLSDIDTRTTSLTPGMKLIVDTVPYFYESSYTIASDVLGLDVDLWANVPGRLVLVTCMQNADGSPRTHNLIITAWLEGYGP